MIEKATVDANDESKQIIGWFTDENLALPFETTVLGVIHVEGGSGNHFYDNLALARARALLPGTLGVPPKEHRQTLWAFETDFIQIPPFPVFGCALDDFIPRDCVYPLKKMVKSDLRLDAIY